MPTLQHHLAATPVHDLRSMASRLDVSSRALRRKPDFIQAIVTFWSTPSVRQSILASLSPAARGALDHLLRVGRTPAALFIAEYGAIRQTRQHGDDGSAPWRTPDTVSEELYYTALLGAADLKPLRSATYFCAPSDIDLTPAASRASSAPTQPLTHASALVPAWTTAYDVAQWLILLHEQMQTPHDVALHSLRTLWPPPHLLRALNGRLAAPESEPLPRAPSQMNRLRLLLFLADAARLHTNGLLTPLGWAWLHEPPEQQTALLWRAWLDATPELRQRYAFADGLLPRPWPAPLLAALAAFSTGITPGQMTEHWLTQTAIPAQYWVHQTPSLSALQRLSVRVIHQVCIAFGLVASHRSRRGMVYRLTPLGDYLLGRPDRPAPLWQPAPATPPAITADDRVWRLVLPPSLPPHIQADLTAYANHVATTRATPDTSPANTVALVQHYRLDDASLARAISAGYGWPGLAAALQRAQFPLADEDWQRLAAQFEQIPRVTLRADAWLHVDRRTDLQSILQNPALRPLIADLLTPTTATLATTTGDVRSRLLAAGIAVLAAATPAASDGPQPSAALWLAARLYRRLADFLPLPIPLPVVQIDDLLAHLPAPQHGALSTYFDQLEAAFLDLLDGRIFAPPPFVGDIAAHRPRLERAAAKQHVLYLDYFSPARNLLTRRPVMPLWLEQLDQRLYLRAECLLSGRILLFRVDRIRAIWDAPPADSVT